MKYKTFIASVLIYTFLELYLFVKYGHLALWLGAVQATTGVLMISSYTQIKKSMVKQ